MLVDGSRGAHPVNSPGPEGSKGQRALPGAVPYLLAMVPGHGEKCPALNYHSMSADTLRDTQAELRKLYDEFVRAGACPRHHPRQKPAPDQLDLSNGLLSLPGDGDYLDAAGTDTRNYGGIAGLKESARDLRELLGVDAGDLIAFGNSSLQLMHDDRRRAVARNPDSSRPWIKEETVKFLCPARATTGTSRSPNRSVSR